MMASTVGMSITLPKYYQVVVHGPKKAEDSTRDTKVLSALELTEAQELMRSMMETREATRYLVTTRVMRESLVDSDGVGEVELDKGRALDDGSGTRNCVFQGLVTVREVENTCFAVFL